MSSRRLVFAASALCALATAACSDENFTVEYASDYAKASAHSVSFFGIFQDGRLNASAWDRFGPRFSSSFVGAPCPAMFGSELSTESSSDLSGAVEAYARNNGVTDNLLEKISPMAKGDIIVVVTIAGHPPQPIGDAGVRAPPPAAPMRGMGRRGLGGGGGGGRSPEPATDHNVFELAASLYSVSAKHSVGVVAMSYDGPSVAEALSKFTARFQQEMAGSRCGGWSWDRAVDADAIRKLADE